MTADFTSHLTFEFSHCAVLTIQMEKFESVQYTATLPVTGSWRGTSQEKLYDKRGWESVSLRCLSRRRILFCKLANNLTPDHTIRTIPHLQESSYDLRRRTAIQ